MSLEIQSFPAPAKLNLMLRIVGRRADGYHLLQTVFRFIDYGDTLSFRVRGDGVIARVNTVSGIDAADDLAVRAARALRRHAGAALGADVVVEKRVPLGAGLGGGSSDAATTLLALNRLWGLDLPKARLLDIALELGADVPVFVFGDNAVGEGIGEQLRPIALPPAWYVVLTPAVVVATARIFSHPDLKQESKTVRIQSFSAELAANDLELLVCREYPEVGRHLDWLRQFGRAMMSGSGGGVFASFENENVARAVLAQLPGSMKGFVARGLERHPLRDLAR